MRLFRKRDAQEVIRKEAVQWVRELADDDVTADDEARLAEWLRRSPEHERQFLVVRAFWELTAWRRGRRRPSRLRGYACLIVAVCLLAAAIGALVTRLV